MGGFHVSTPIARWQPPVANLAALPATGNTTGDVRMAIATHTPYMWDGAAWQSAGGGGGAAASEYDAGNSGSSKALDFSTNGANQKLTLTAGTCVLTVTVPTAGTWGVLRLVQDATGSRVITRAAQMQFKNYVDPTLTTTPGQVDIIDYYSDGTVMYCDVRTNYYPTAVNFQNTKSLTVDGVSKYVTFGNVYAIDTNSVFSISFWVKLLGDGSIITKYNGVGWEIYNSSGVIDFGFYGNGNTCIITNDVALSTNTWYHIVFTANGTDATGYKMYVNGTLRTTTPTNTVAGSSVSAAPFQFGARNGGSFGHSTLDEVSVWTGHTLSGSEVTAIYNSGHPGDLSVLSFVASLTNWYRMGDSTDSSTSIIDRIGGNNGTPTNIVSGDFTTDVP